MSESNATPAIQSFNPATKQLLGEVPVTSAEKLDTGIARARAAQAEWGATSLKTRAEILASVRKAIARQGKSLARLIAAETGKTEWEGWIEVLQTVEHFRAVTAIGPTVLKRERRSAGILKTKRAFVNYLSFGVAGIISPWNYPLILTVGPIAEALMAGNVVVVKPSEWTPLVGQALENLFAESRLPSGLVEFVYGYSSVGSQIVDSPDVDLICFTGSVSVGRKIARRCGELLKPVILELGGNDPLIVLEDANLERAAAAAVWGGFTNAGQTCISVERVIVVESVAEKFIELLKEKTA
ncbi:MAG: aldehyde dehydrogenase family protein, partial [Fidelibacterota bacterium]